MARLLALPFAILLAVVSFGLIAAGVALLQESAEERPGRQATLVNVGTFSEGDDRDDPAAAIAGASMVGFGVLGFIGAVALLIMSLSGEREPAAAMPLQQQQQQQQVVVVQRPDGSYEVHDGVRR